MSTKESAEFMSKTTQVLRSNIGTILVVMVLMLISIYAIVSVYKKYNETSLSTVTVLSKPSRIPDTSLSFISSEVKLPNNVNGKEYSYSFWVYIDAEQIEQTANNKFLMGRLNSNVNVSNGSPIFMLDKTMNKMHVYVKKTGDDVVAFDDIPDAYRESTLTIPYVPMQRWINIILVVDNNFLQLFMDGELRQVKDLTTFNALGNQTNVVASPIGNLAVGSSGGVPSFKGFISKVQVFNYAISIDHAKIIYQVGPLNKSVLSNIGIPYYGIQNPFYRIDERMKSCME